MRLKLPMPLDAKLVTLGASLLLVATMVLITVTGIVFVLSLVEST